MPGDVLRRWRSKRDSRHVGRVREGLAELLSVEIGDLIDPADLRPQTGAWRTDHRLDVCRWEATLPVGFGGRGTPAMCWSTMTECVKAGVYLEQDGPTWDVWPLDHSAPDQAAHAAWQKAAVKASRIGKTPPPCPATGIRFVRWDRDPANQKIMAEHEEAGRRALQGDPDHG